MFLDAESPRDDGVPPDNGCTVRGGTGEVNHTHPCMIITKPSAVRPAAPKPAVAPPAYNPAPTVEDLTCQLSQMTLIVSKASQILGNPGPGRDLPAFAAKIMAELNGLRAQH